MIQHRLPAGDCRLPLPVLATACIVKAIDRGLSCGSTLAANAADCNTCTKDIRIQATKHRPCTRATSHRVQKAAVFIATHRTCSSALHTGFLSTPTQRKLKPSSIGRHGGMGARCKVGKQTTQDEARRHVLGGCLLHGKGDDICRCTRHAHAQETAHVVCVYV